MGTLQIGADVLGRRLSGNLHHCWQVTPAVHWQRVTFSTKDKDPYAGDEEFRGRRSIHLERITSRPENCNSLPIGIRSTCEGPRVRLIDSASEDHLWRALQIYSSSSSSPSLSHQVCRLIKYLQCMPTVTFPAAEHYHCSLAGTHFLSCWG